MTANEKRLIYAFSVVLTLCAAVVAFLPLTERLSAAHKGIAAYGRQIGEFPKPITEIPELESRYQTLKESLRSANELPLDTSINEIASGYRSALQRHGISNARYTFSTDSKTESAEFTFSGTPDQVVSFLEADSKGIKPYRYSSFTMRNIGLESTVYVTARIVPGMVQGPSEIKTRSRARILSLFRARTISPPQEVPTQEPIPERPTVTNANGWLTPLGTVEGSDGVKRLYVKNKTTGELHAIRLDGRAENSTRLLDTNGGTVTFTLNDTTYTLSEALR